MNGSVLKNQTKTIDYERNLNKLIGRSDSAFKILERSYGILKGKLKISPVAWQRKIRKEWEVRLKRQYKIGSKKSA
ncbi:MAG: hypothetical protein AAB661_02470 [Patescibacteria group bacterium]